MSVQIVSDQTENNFALAVERVIQKRPLLEPIVRSFAEVLSEKNRIARQLETESPFTRLNIDPSRLLQGVPLLAGTSLEVLDEQLNRSFHAMLTVLKRTFSHLAADFSFLESLHRQGRLNLSELSRAYLDGQTSVLDVAAESAKTSEGILAFVLNNTLSTVLQALEPTLKSYVGEVQWYRGYCPICGSMPSVSYLTEAGDLGSEFLKGGGGQKYLHCSLCGHDWRFIRSKCPVCETEDKDLQVYFQSEDERSERVDVCQNCAAYLPCIDLRESTFRPPMDIAAVSMVHLDVWALEKGYHPSAQTPWNML